VSSSPGRKRTIILRDPPGPPPSIAHLIVTNALGSIVLDQVLTRLGERPIQQWLGLEPGRYFVSMEANGKRGTGTLIVSEDFSGPEKLEITLAQ
jgi:hypothetical protein